MTTSNRVLETYKTDIEQYTLTNVNSIIDQINKLTSDFNVSLVRNGDIESNYNARESKLYIDVPISIIKDEDPVITIAPNISITFDRNEQMFSNDLIKLSFKYHEYSDGSIVIDTTFGKLRNIQAYIGMMINYYKHITLTINDSVIKLTQLPGTYYQSFFKYKINSDDLSNDIVNVLLNIFSNQDVLINSISNKYLIRQCYITIANIIQSLDNNELQTLTINDMMSYISNHNQEIINILDKYLTNNLNKYMVDNIALSKTMSNHNIYEELYDKYIYYRSIKKLDFISLIKHD